jgi:hypothetical protein
MTPKEKAIELFEIMKWEGEMGDEECFFDFAKQCALIAVNEIINSWDIDLYKDCGSSFYWQEVKQEIENK